MALAEAYVRTVAPRLVDLFTALPAITGKIEMMFEDRSAFALKHAKPRDHFERAFLMKLVVEDLLQNLRIAREDLDSAVTRSPLVLESLLRSR